MTKKVFYSETTDQIMEKHKLWNIMKMKTLTSKSRIQGCNG